MILIDFVNEVNSQPGIVSQTISSGTVQGASFDYRNSQEPMAMAVNCSINSTVNVTTLVIQAEQSTNGTGNWTVIPGIAPGTLMQLFISSTTAATNLYQTTAGFRQYEFARINIATVTAASNTTGANVTIGALLLQQKKYIPTDSGGYDRSPSS